MYKTLRGVLLVLLMSSNGLQAADTGYIEIIGVMTTAKPQAQLPDPSDPPSLEDPYGPPSYDPSQFDPTIGDPPSPTGPDLNPVPGAACGGHLVAFVSNPEYLQPLVDFSTCASVAANSVPPYVLSYLPYLFSLIGEVFEPLTGISDDIGEVEGYSTDLGIWANDAIAGAPLSLTHLIGRIVGKISDYVLTAGVDGIRQYVVTCHIAVAASDNANTPGILAGDTYVRFSGRTGCSAVVPINDVGTFPVYLTGGASIRDIVSGASVKSASSTSLPAFLVYANNIESAGSWNGIGGSAYKVQYNTAITADFPGCLPSAPICNITWAVVPNKSLSTATQLACAASGETLNCTVDSAPFVPGIAGPPTPSLGKAP